MYECKVIRGGSWYGGTRHVRTTYRLPGDPGFRFVYLGFRICVKKVQHV